MRSRPFVQVDVFTAEPYLGNPVAVVLDAEGLTDEQMAAFARWTNLSETTFLLPPTTPEADYRLRIFTPGGELPFAGHPTIGSAHAWLEAGGTPCTPGAPGTPRTPGALVQECGVGLVRLRQDGAGRIALAAPPLRHSGPIAPELRARVAACLRIREEEILEAAWVDNGPTWIGVLLGDGDAVLALEPDFVAMGELEVGVVGLYEPGRGTDAEVRAFVPGLGINEDPVTGSLNASLAQWLIPAGVLPERYVVSQGAALRRAGRVYAERVGEDFWIGGDAVTCIAGEVRI
jgi:PhzF family phenazine biosynthesis protein